jgi:hypothetical protein
MCVGSYAEGVDRSSRAWTSWGMLREAGVCPHCVSSQASGGLCGFGAAATRHSSTSLRCCRIAVHSYRMDGGLHREPSQGGRFPEATSPRRGVLSWACAGPCTSAVGVSFRVFRGPVLSACKYARPTGFPFAEIGAIRGQLLRSFSAVAGNPEGDGASKEDKEGLCVDRAGRCGLVCTRFGT